MGKDKERDKEKRDKERDKEKDKDRKKHHHHRDEGEERDQEKDRKKSRKKSEKLAKMFGYSNDVNPFGDSNLLQPFVWGKKVEKDKQQGKQTEDPEGERFKLIQDIDKVRKRRADRERELEEMQRLRDEEMRLREMAQYGDWEEKEEDFHMQQTRVRSKLRLIEKREKPIDLLAKNILLIESGSSQNEEEFDMAMNLAQLEGDVADPLSLLDGLSDEDLSQLLDDVTGYVEIERKKQSPYLNFWEALHQVVTAENRNRTRKDTTLHKSVLADVQRMFADKSSRELLSLRDDIRRSIRDGSRTDIEYWELMEKEVGLEYSRAIIRETHQDLLAKQIEILTNLREEAAKKSVDANGEDDRDERGKKRPREGVDYRFIKTGPEKPTILDDNGELTEPIDGAEFDNSEGMKFMRHEEDEEIEEMEEQMHIRDEIVLPGSTYWWQDKYRPRKPRYYNRVKTGYDWNKYNSTHYDQDNPPPKTIQGYKFNIFFPDLIDTLQTPKYFLEAAEENEFAIIRFHSGPPYEDIAFKILNQEWDIGRKSGFKCVFERGVLQLHFNFKRHRYRR